MGLCASNDVLSRNSNVITNLDSTALKLVSMHVIVQMSKTKTIKVNALTFGKSSVKNFRKL